MRKFLGILFMIGLSLFMLAVWLQNYYFVNEIPRQGLVLEVWNKPPSRQVKELKLWKEQILLFEQEHPDIKINGVEREFLPQEFVAAMAGNKGPDVMHIWVGTLPILAREGFIAPVDGYIANWDQKDSIPPIVWEPTRVDNKTYGVPRDTFFTVLFYRKDLFIQAGLDPDQPPRNWAELADYAQKLTDAQAGRYGLGLPPATWYFMDFVWQNGGEMVQRSPHGQMEANLSSPAIVETLQYWRDLKDRYKVLPPNNLPSAEDVAQMFALGRVAMMIGVANQLPTLINKYGLDLKNTGIAPLPAGPQGLRASHAGGEVYIINASIPLERQKAAWQYIEFELSPGSQLWKWKRMNELEMTIFPGAFAASTSLLNMQEFAMVKDAMQYARNEPHFDEWVLMKDAMDRDLLQAIFVDPHLNISDYVQNFNLKINQRFFPFESEKAMGRK